jgi:hypothetical protein
MNQSRDIERLLDQWLADGSSVAPDRVIDIVSDRIERQPQRPVWRLDWRHLQMNPLAKAGAAIAAVVLIALVGYTLLPGGSSGVGGPAPSASPTATRSPAPSAKVLPDGRLTAGNYSARPFGGDAAGVTLTFDVPDRWTGFPEWALAGPLDTAAPHGIGMAFFQADGAFDDPCHWDKAGTGTLEGQPGETPVGPTVDDLVADLRANTSYTTTTPVDVVIDGYAGKQLTIQMPSDVDPVFCDNEKGDGIGNSWIFTSGAGPYEQGVANRSNLRIVDVDGQRVIVVVKDYVGTPAEDQAAAQAIVDSIRITP